SHFESMLPEKPERIVGSLSHATMNPYLALVREFSQSIPQLVQRQVHRSFDATALMLCRLTDINNQGICRRQLCPRRQGSIATHHIACDHASYIDGIFGAAVLRGVAEFALFEIEHCAMLLNRHRNHVDASLDTFLSHSLRPQHSSVRVSINDLQVDRLGARIVSGMVSGVEIDCRKIRDPGSAKALFGCSRHRNSQAETGADRGSLGSPELRITSANRIRRNSPLPARRSSQGQERPFPRYEIAHLDSIPDRPDMRVGGAHGFVHADAAFWAYFEPGGFCKIGLGPP